MLTDGAPMTVLVADPDPYVSRVVSAGLAYDAKYRVTPAFHGRDALTAAIAAPFDVILWAVRQIGDDTNLPRVRALCPGATLILMTTDDRLDLGAEYMPLDVAGLLIKPFSLEALRSRLRGVDVVQQPALAHTCGQFAVVGQRIELVTTSGRISTRVYSLDHDSFVVMGAPRVQETPDLAVGTVLTAEVTGSDALYTTRTRILAHLDIPVPAWRVKLPGTVHRQQRRRHPRVVLQLVASLTYRDGSAHGRATGALPASTSLVSCIIANLSLGGGLVVAAAPISVGAAVVLDVGPGASQVLSCSGRVLRATPRFNRLTGESEGYAVAIQFDRLTPLQREAFGRLVHSGR